MEITYLPIDQIIPPPKSDSNRLVGIDSLALNIKAVQQAVPESTGILNALVVRIHQGADSSRTMYDIVAGRRRYAAALKLKLDKIPVTIVSTSDDNAQAITVAENFQRVPLTPLEEATAIAKMRELGQTNDEIAASLGESVAFVIRRSKLIDLSPAWRKVLADPDGGFKGWSVAMLELVARYPHERQDAILKSEDPSFIPNLDELKTNLARDDQQLKNAPFNLKDETLLPKAGACVNCPKRASAQPLLFSDDADSLGDPKKDRCIDPTCWTAKVNAHQANKLKALQAEHPEATLVSTKQPYELRNNPLPAKVLNANQYSQVGKKTEGAKPALLVDGAARGQLIWISEDKHNAGSGARSVRAKIDEKKKPITDKERAQRLRDRRNAWIVSHIRETLLAKEPKGMIQSGPLRMIDTMLAVVAAFGLNRHHDYVKGKFKYNNGIANDWSGVTGAKDVTTDALALLVWVDFAKDMRQRLNFQNGPGATALVKEHAPLLEILGVTYEELWKLAAAEIPDRHNFLGENSDTPSPAKEKKSAKVKDYKLNKNGVFTKPERINIPIATSLKISANILLAQDKDGTWYVHHHLKYPNGESSGLPGKGRKDQSAPTRDEAFAIGFHDLCASIKSSMGNNPSESGEKNLAKALEQVKAEGVKLLNGAADKFKPAKKTKGPGFGAALKAKK